MAVAINGGRMNLNRWTAVLVGTPLLLISFQNCSDFALQDDVVYLESLSSMAAELDNKFLPSLIDSSDMAYWNPDGLGDSIKKNPILGKASAIVVALDRNSTGKVVSIHSGATSEECSIYIEGNVIRGLRYSSGTSYSYVDTTVPSVGTKMVLVVSCGEAAGSLSLMVNGITQVATQVKAGTPVDFSYLSKTVSLGNTAGVIHEVMAYSVQLSNAQLNVLSRFIAANQQIANVVLDPALLSDTSSGGGGSGTTLPSAAFIAAKAVFDGKCLSCHASGSSYGAFANLTEASAVSRGLVIKGNPNSSILYYRLIGSAGAGGAKNMPQGGSISAAEVQAVADWISSIK
jgi:mono/diheme cytochrome c family protein